MTRVRGFYGHFDAVSHCHLQASAESTCTHTLKYFVSVCWLEAFLDHPRFNMPAQSTLDTDDISKLRSAIPKPSNNILYATLARIYFAYPQPNRWSYGGLQGALAFVRDTTTNLYSFKLVDLNGTRGVVWTHELYDGFEYFLDRPFLHSFAGDVSSLCSMRKLEIKYFTGMHDWLCICRRKGGKGFPQEGPKQEREMCVTSPVEDG